MEMTEYPSRRDPKVVITAIAVVVVIIIATAAVIRFSPMFNPVQQRTLTVYTYGSFMDWGDDNDTAFFAPFEERYDVNVIIDRRADDANTLVAILEAESANPIADVVIGIDNILILEQAARSVLEPFTPANLSLIDESIVTALDPEHYVVPFDFGLVTIIYSMADMNTTTHPELANLTFA
jgi:ABC-type thiamine transport system substrate-binding protein